MEQLDDRLEAGIGARAECTVPQGPVVPARLGFGQTPGCAVPDDVDAEPGDVGEILLHQAIVTGLRELVLAVRHAVPAHDRIRPLLADGPHEVGKRVCHLSCASVMPVGSNGGSVSRVADRRTPDDLDLPRAVARGVFGGDVPHRDRQPAVVGVATGGDPADD